MGFVVIVFRGLRHGFSAAIDHVRRILRTDGLFYFTCPTRDDGKYGFGQEVAPHTFLCERSVTAGGIHYFADEADLDELLSGFVQVRKDKKEGYWDNRETQQFHSSWCALARNPDVVERMKVLFPGEWRGADTPQPCSDRA